MRFPPVLRPVACLAVAALMMSGVARADDARELARATQWARKVTGRTCDFAASRPGKEIADSHVYRIRYRHPGQDQDSPDAVFPLYQLPCTRSASDAAFVYLTKADGEFRLLSFAEPKLDYDYADESFSSLKTPPKVAGYITASALAGSTFDSKANSISMKAKWRRQGDAWSSGTWQFDDGEFVLKRYDVDPTYEGRLDDNGAKAPTDRESYQVFPIVERNQ